MIGDRLGALPIPVRPHNRENAEAYVIRLAVANHLRPSYLRQCLTPNRRGGYGGIQPDKLAAVSGRDRVVLLRLFPELAESGRPRRQNTDNTLNAVAQQRKRRNDANRRAVWAAIRCDADTGMSNRAIERKHHVGWTTVQRALAAPTPPARMPYPRRRRGIDALIPQIDTMLATNPDLPIKTIWTRLVDEHHIPVTYQAVRLHINERRATTHAALPAAGS